MKATMKQMVAANRVGIISTPNQPTYRRLLVEVTHSQNRSQFDERCCCSVVCIFKRVSNTAGNSVRSIPVTPLVTGIRDVIYPP